MGTIHLSVQDLTKDIKNSTKGIKFVKNIYRVIPKVEYFNTMEQFKLMATDQSLKTRHRYYNTQQVPIFIFVSYAEHCFLILSVRNLPDISQFEG